MKTAFSWAHLSRDEDLVDALDVVALPQGVQALLCGLIEGKHQ